MSFPPYENYRDSGIEWLRALPSHWQTRRLRTLVEIKKRIAGVEGPNVLSITQNGIRLRDLSSNDGQLAESYAHYQIVEVGDFAMNHMDLLTGWIDIASQDGVTSPDYRVFSLRSFSGSDPRFLLRVLQNAYASRIFYAFGQGASHFGRWRLPTDAFQEFFVPLPPIKEQEAIAAFLDRETAKIDALVEAQRRLIELLKEKRQAVISHAVTKGFDPSAPMKDSGIEWLGDVPAHWTVAQLKYLIFFQRGHDLPSQDRVEGDVPIVSSGGVIGTHNKSIAHGPAIVTGRYGSVGSFQIFQGHYWPLNTALYSVELNGSPYFIRHALEHIAPLFVMNARKSAVPGVDRNDLHPLPVAIPPVEEQALIAAELDRQLEKLHALAEQANLAINLLNERRAALIAAAVAGKIDVRAWVASDVRNAVAAEIIYLHARKPTFGRVKNQKLLYLAETHAGIREIGGNYERQAAGPYDSNLMSVVERELEAAGVIAVRQPEGRGSTVSYSISRGWMPNRERLNAMLGDRLAAFEHVNAKLADLDTRGAEAVATLYAVWNDSLIDGEVCDDARVIRGFLDEWHREKREKFKESELRTWLGWMRRNGVVPAGRGPRTDTGRLFA